MSPLTQRLRLLASILSVLAILVLGTGAWFYFHLRASLPQLDGTARVAGLAAPVSVERDALGVPVIRGTSRADVARALGFLHAQDRFFQMDLLRRRAAGELAELFGPVALPLDRTNRRHGFRALAGEVMARAAPEERAVIEAYVAGVNAGLGALSARPFEYGVLRVAPAPWRAEDCALVGYAMALTLEDDSGRYERSLDTLRDAYGATAVAFFAPLVGPADAALDGSTAPVAPIPPPGAIDLRREAPAAVAAIPSIPAPALAWAEAEAERYPGSNSFAVAGAHTAHGAALLANDMHLDLAVPNVWWRASLHWREADGTPRVVSGVTLPGLPLVIAGSNGRVAWGFTAAQVDTGDVIAVTPAADPERYHVLNGGTRAFEHRRDTIRVKGGKPVAVDYRWTIWGPIVGANRQERPLAYHWIEDDPAALNFGLMALERAATAGEAVAIAHRAGLPAFNFLVADAAGRIAWTIAGPLPRRVGYTGRLPISWIYGDRRWDGWLPPEQVPTVSDPGRPYLWTANNRLLGGPALALLGDGAYARPARAAQIRDDLRALVPDAAARVRPADLLGIALDDRAVFLGRWRQLLLDTLAGAGPGGPGGREDLRAAVEGWDGRAGVKSAGYTLVRKFRTEVVRRTLTPIFAPCVEVDSGFDWHRFNYEEAVWALVQAKPLHLLDPQWADWSDLLLTSADDVTKSLHAEGTTAARAAWGRRNRLAMRHPFARVLPGWLVGWLNMPAEALAGDLDMPRVQAPGYGASERFVVAPGHEDEGIFEMPGGQSGHPLSPFYRAGHEAWVRGEATPFLPGPAAHKLMLTP